jgi:hypothetical protein
LLVVQQAKDGANERAAEALLARAGAGSAPDAIELARRMGLAPRPGPVQRAALTDQGTLTYRADARATDQQRWVSNVLAEWWLRQSHLEPTPERVAYTAAALLLPRDAFMRAVEQNGWNVRELQTLYPNVSIGTIAVRIAMVHDAVVTWFDHGRVRWRSTAPEGRSDLVSPSRFEQHLAEIALESDTVLHPEPRMWAFPLNRKVGAVLLVCDARDLAARER